MWSKNAKLHYCSRKLCVCVEVVGAELCREGVKMLLPEIWKAVHGMLFWTVGGNRLCLTLDFKLSPCSECPWRQNRLSVLKRRHMKFRCQGITQKKAYKETVSCVTRAEAYCIDANTVDRWGLCPSGMFSSSAWYLVADISGQPVGLIFRVPDSLFKYVKTTK
jgi:hypothetical protein